MLCKAVMWDSCIPQGSVLYNPPPPLPTCLHLSVSVFVGVTAALALPSEFLQLGLAALDGLGFRPALALVLLQGGLRAKDAFGVKTRHFVLMGYPERA